MKRNSTTRRLLLLVAVLLAAGLVWGLAEAVAASPSPASGKVVLKIGWPSEPDNLNPFIGWSTTTYEIWAINYDFLFSWGINNQPILDLASQWPTKQNGAISPDGKIWTIHLRPNLKWSDGHPLTAADVAFTYNYTVKNHMANMGVTIVNLAGAKEINPTTVQITCSHPKADMERIFLPILPKHIWEHVSPQAAATSYVNKPPIVGSGPFYTAAFKKGSYIEMVRNPYYWGTKPTIDEIFFETYQNVDTMVADLKSGAIDAAWGIPEAQFKPLSSQAGIHTIAYNFYSWDYLNLNCDTQPSSMGNPVLRDVRFRDALNYAIDRVKLCQLAYEGLAAPATTILPPNTWLNPDYHWQPPAGQAYSFDLAKASQLLTAAGYPLRNGVRLDKQGKPISLRLWTMTDFREGQIEVKLIAGWLQQLGLKINLSVLDRGADEARVFNFKGSTYAPDFDMYVDDWAGYTDPGQTLTSETTAQIGSTNEPCWSNAAFDKLNVEQAAALDPTARQKLIWRMQQVMDQQTPWVVLVYPQWLEAYSTARWTGWTQSMNGHGPAFMNTGGVQQGVDSILDLRPVTGSSGGGAGSAIIAIVIAVLIVIAGAAIWLLRRSRVRAEEA
jgi:peptide/nickel transport system substrate-binding protein